VRGRTVALVGAFLILAVVAGAATSLVLSDQPAETTEDEEYNTSVLDPVYTTYENQTTTETPTDEVNDSEAVKEVSIASLSADCYKKTEEIHACEWSVTLSGDYDLVYVLPENKDITRRSERPENGTVSDEAWNWPNITNESTIERYIYVVDVGPDGFEGAQYVGTAVMNHETDEIRIIKDKPCEFGLADAELSYDWEGGCVESTNESSGDSS